MSVSSSVPEPTNPRVKHKVRHADHQGVDREALTPMMRHYVEMKDEYPHALLLYRVGDFYETFFQDACTVSRELELVLTSKEGGKEIGRVPMAGIPHHALDRYCRFLVGRGYAIAICDQVEDPAEAQGLVRREITRVLTPGTVLEEGMLSARCNNFLAAVVLAGQHWGLAYADISTGEFLTTQASDLEQLSQELMRLQPSEILVPADAPDLNQLLRPGQKTDGLPECLPHQFCYTLRSQTPFSQTEARQRLLETFRVRSLEGMGCEHLPLAVRAAGGLLEYLEDTQKETPIPLQPLCTYTTSEFLILDHQTRRNLEITQTVRDGTFHGSLLWALDKTCTAMGGRALRRWLLQPLLDIAQIQARQDTIQELIDNSFLRKDLQSLLDQIYDLERLAGRAGAGTANARDLVALADSLSKLSDLGHLVAAASSPYLQALQTVPPALEQLGQRVQAHLVDAPPLSVTEGHLIRSQVNSELDNQRQQIEQDQQWIANLEVTEKARTGIPTLKVGFNKTFGYYISISRAKTEQAPDDYIRKQTLTNEERYITPALKETEARLLSAQADLNRLEYEIFADLRTQVGDQAELIRTVAAAVAAADVLSALAEASVYQGYCRPRITEGRQIKIVEGRHPVVEQSLPAGFFVPNSTDLGNSDLDQCRDPETRGHGDPVEEEDAGTRGHGDTGMPLQNSPPPPFCPSPRPHLDQPGNHPDLIVLTGPNASGKSCYLRQVGLIQLMAQTGSFVPAQSATLAVCDRIFTRVGAVDDLATGQSTFMVEMNETANILNHATPRSLVLLDEIGRGTATFDGLSIAWAVAEYLATEIKAKTIFATHYHELNELASLLVNVANYQVTVKELPEQIIFLHQVQPGGADRSYGIEAGRLAGLPAPVIQRARQVMHQIEKHSKIAVGLRKGSQGDKSSGQATPSRERARQRATQTAPTEHQEQNVNNQPQQFELPF